ncbi:MAG: 30S ribosomal protein S6 [Desulfobacterales bacterium]|jgi:small subunit ribosomal protein S6
MRRYETIVIIDPDLSAEKREPVLERVKDVIAQQSGYLAFVDDWGNRKLAYEIKKKERGHYVRFDFCGTAAVVDEIERFFRIDDRALKYMTVLLDKSADIEKIKEEVAAAESKAEVPEEPPKPAETEAAAEQTAPAEIEPPEDQAEPSEKEATEDQVEPSEKKAAEDQAESPEVATSEHQEQLSEEQPPEPKEPEADTTPIETEEEIK